MENNSGSGFSHFTNKRPKFKRAFGAGGGRGGGSFGRKPFGHSDRPNRFSSDSNSSSSDRPARDYTPRQGFAQARPAFGSRQPGGSYGGRPSYGAGRSFGGNSGRSFGGRGGAPRGGGRGGGKRFGSVDPKLLVATAVEVKEEVFVPKHKFEDFGLEPVVLTNLVKKGYKEPTPIQDDAIKFVAAGHDVLGIANTGTGKTAAFLLPLITKFIKSKNERALVIVPTRELAGQIVEEYVSFTRHTHLHSQLCIGGASMYLQRKGLAHRPNLVVGTPGRLKDLYEQKILDFSDFGTIVLDEVDTMLDMGFIKDVEYIVSHLKSPRQSLFFSATVNDDVRRIMDRFLKDPKVVNVRKTATARNVEQDIVKVAPSKKFETLANLLAKEQLYKVIVFGRTKHGVNKLEKMLRDKEFSVVALHGNKSQQQRNRALETFKRGDAQVLLATDVASRGIDISGVTHVINYDLPATYDDYVHRIGRTGRAGNRGHAISFVEVGEAPNGAAYIAR